MKIVESGKWVKISIFKILYLINKYHCKKSRKVKKRIG
jgi:hypothetical protein